MKTVGVVIPIYNVEKYLRECLDSVINQTYKNLQVVLVNDGSTDENSLNIAKEYTLKDKRFILFDKENGGLSSARNVGIEYFSGEYKLKNKTQTIKENSLIEFNIEGNNPYEIYTVYKSYKAFNNEKDLTHFTYPNIDYIIFLDSDDYWELDCIEECVPRMDGVEVVWFDWKFLYEYYNPDARVTLIDRLEFTSSNKYSIDFLISKMQNLNQDSFWFGWHGMINFKYLCSIKLKFIDRLLHEDHYFGKLLFFQAKQIYVYTKKKISYRIRKGSIMNYTGENSYVPSYALSEYNALNCDYFLYKKYHRNSSLFLTAMMVFKFIKEDNKIKDIESFKQIFYKKLKLWRNNLVDFDEFFLEKVLFLSFQEFFRLSSDYRVNLELISEFIADIVKTKNDSIQNLNQAIKNKDEFINNLLSFQTKYGTAKFRIQNQLSYKLGQALIINSKSVLGFLSLPFIILSIVISHKQEQKAYKFKVKKNPNLALPPLETYPDYKEALKEKECFTYKLGEALIQASKNWYGGGDYSYYLIEFLSSIRN